MEQRRYNRFVVEELGIGGKMLFATDIVIHDISLGGICISLEKKLNMGNEYLLEADHDQRGIRLKATVVWEKISGSRRNVRGEVVPVYTVGMRFSDVVADQGKDLEDFITKVANDTSLRLTGVRIKFDIPEKGVLRHPQKYTVKSLSLGGMCIEIEYMLEIDKQFTMEIYFPSDEVPIKFLGRIASCLPSPGTESGRYEIGVEFLSMPEKDKSRLESFIKTLG
jgi:c-di-GMP-binding flagellar brake protein YcgR